AAGTSPNTVYEREYPGTFSLDEGNRFFQKHRVELSDGTPLLKKSAPGESGFFLSYENNNRFVSFYGDNHPDYAGNVVKAMASAKDGYPHVASLFKEDVRRAESGGVPWEPWNRLV